MAPSANFLARATRRQFIKAGIAGSFALTGAGFFGGVKRAGAQSIQANFSTLTPEGQAILRALTPVVLDGCLPTLGEARARAVDDVVGTIDRYMSHLPPAVQKEAADAFGLLHFPLFRMFVAGIWRRWPEATPDALQASLVGFRDSRFQLLRSLYAFLQSILVVGWFDQPAAWPHLGYEGPPTVSRSSAEPAA